MEHTPVTAAHRKLRQKGTETEASLSPQSDFGHSELDSKTLLLEKRKKG